MFNKKYSFWSRGNIIGLIQEHLLVCATKMKISRNKWKSWLKEEFGGTSWRLDWKTGRHEFLKCFQTRGPEIPVNSVPHYNNSVLSEWGLGTSESHHAHLRRRGRSHWCLEPVAPGFPSENGGVCGLKGWKFLGLSLWRDFIRASPKSEVFNGTVIVELFCRNLWWG